MLAALMARRPVSKELRRQLQPLTPAFVPSAKAGARKLAVSDEAALNGILSVLQTGIPWENLHWSGVDAAGQLVQPARTVLGFCHSSAAVMLTPMPCLGGGKNYYQAERH